MFRSKTCSLVFAALLSLCGTQVYAQSHYATSQGQEYYDRGIKLEQKADANGDNSFYEDAASEYREAISTDPNFLQAYERLGYVLYVLKRYDESVQYLNNGLRRDPENLSLKHYLGIDLYQLGRTDEAERMLKDVVAQRSDLPEAFFILGKIRLDNHDAKGAQPYFERYAELTPGDAQAYRALSSAYIQARDIPNAEASLSELLRLVPDDVIACINMGHVKYELGRYDEAVDYYNRAYQKDQRRTDLLYTIASVYYLAGDYANASEHFGKVLEQNESHMAAQYFLADSELKQGNLEKADAFFASLLGHMPNYTYVKLKRAYISMLRGDKDSVKRIKRIIKGTTNADSVHLGAVMLRKSGDAADSLTMHKGLYESHKDSPVYGIYLAREYFEVGEYGKAVPLLEQIVSEDADNALAGEMLSMALLTLGDEAVGKKKFDDAKKYYNRAEELNIHPVNVACCRARLLLVRGKKDDAYREFLKVEKDHPTHPDVMRMSAHFDMLDGKHAEAVTKLSAVSGQYGDSALGGSGYYMLAVAQSSTGDWDGAAGSLDRAKALGVVEPKATSIISLQRALKAYNDGDFDGLDAILAEIDESQDVFSDSDKIRYKYLKAHSLIKKQNFSQAKSMLQGLNSEYGKLPSNERNKIFTSPLDMPFELAYIYYETGSYDDALSQLNKSSSSDSKTLEVAIRRKLAVQAIQKKKYDQAVDHYNKLNAITTLTSTDQYNQTLAKVITNKVKSGDALEKQARQNIPEAVLNYAIYLDNSGDGQQAIKYYERYVSMSNARKAEDVKQMLSTKQRVWGSGTSE